MTLPGKAMVPVPIREDLESCRGRSCPWMRSHTRPRLVTRADRRGVERGGGRTGLPHRRGHHCAESAGAAPVRWGWSEAGIGMPAYDL